MPAQHIGRLYAYGRGVVIRECLRTDGTLSRIQGLDEDEATYYMSHFDGSPHEHRGHVPFAADGELPLQDIIRASGEWPDLVFTVASYDPETGIAKGVAFAKGAIVETSEMTPDEFTMRFAVDGSGDALPLEDENRLFDELETPLDIALGLKAPSPGPKL